MMAKALNVGMIGYGFMGRAHSNAWRQVGNFFPSCGRRPGAAGGMRARRGQGRSLRRPLGLCRRSRPTGAGWSSAPTSTLVDICVPNNLHKEIALAAAAAGKMVLCEKPLAMKSAEGEAMVAAVEQAGVPNLVWYNYRRDARGQPGQAVDRRGPDRPALPLPGAVPAGLDDRSGRAAGRRRRSGGSTSSAAGSGVTGDLLAHYLDTAMWLNGPITRVMAETETFVKERLHQETGKVEPVGHRRCRACSCAASPTARWACSRARATPAATRRSRPSR